LGFFYIKKNSIKRLFFLKTANLKRKKPNI